MKKGHPDYILIGTLIILLILGVLMISSISAPFSQERFGFPFYYLKRQVFWGILPGIIFGFLAFKIRLDRLKKIIPILFFVNLILLGMVFIPKLGISIGGATRWLALGPISFQPSEPLKIIFIIYLAAWLKKEEISKPRMQKGKIFGEKMKLIAFLIIIGLLTLCLILQPDFSTLGIIVLVAILMYFSAKTHFWYTILIVLIVIGMSFGLIKLAPYRMKRILIFLNPEIDPMGLGYQVRQAQITVGSGGISGLGLGMSHQKLGFLPHPISDSIFAIFAEETGFIGSLILILIFVAFFWRVIEISKRSTEQFSKLVALGIGSWIILQTFWNIGSMIGILPLSGVPLPFISYGASHLIVELVGMGILLNISKQI